MNNVNNNNLHDNNIVVFPGHDQFNLPNLHNAVGMEAGAHRPGGIDDEEIGVEGDEDDDNDDEEEEEEAEDDENNDGNRRRNHNLIINNNDGINIIIDGGVAESHEVGKVPDIVLFLTWKDTKSFSRNHPILRPDVCVKIGLDKNCKLNAVFKRYVTICNEHAQRLNKKNKNNTGSSNSPSNNVSNHPLIDVTDIEFVHCTVLSGHDTYESAALMKNDQISVRRERMRDRERDESYWNAQRESDKLYFEHLRSLVFPSRIISSVDTSNSIKNDPDDGSSPYSAYADLLLHCEGYVKNIQTQQNYVGRPSNMLSSKTFRCHAVILSKRCPWLGDMIRKARQSKMDEQVSRQNQYVNKAVNKFIDDSSQSVITVPTGIDSKPYCNLSNRSIVRQVVEERWNEVVDDNSPGSRDESDYQLHDNNNRMHEDDGVLGNFEIDRENNDVIVVHHEGRGAGVLTGAAHVAESDDEGDMGHEKQLRLILGNPDCNEPSTDNHVRNDEQSLEHNIDTYEADDDDDASIPGSAIVTDIARVTAEAAADPKLLFVHLKNHPPEAVELLLEYCYTNRVIPLGCDAFEQSCRTKRSTFSTSRKNRLVPSLPDWPVSPYSSTSDNSTTLRTSTWPNDGEPTVSFGVAVAGIALAEEAGLHRLSFMCEIAASNLVLATGLAIEEHLSLAIEALGICEHHKQVHQNSLPHLRKSATYFLMLLMRRRYRSVKVEFDRAFQNLERSRNVVGPIFHGIVENIIEEANKNESHGSLSHHGSNNMIKKKSYAALLAALHQRQHPEVYGSSSRDWKPNNDKMYEFFEKIDRSEATERELERRKRRMETYGVRNPHGVDVITSKTKQANKRHRGSGSMILGSGSNTVDDVFDDDEFTKSQLHELAKQHQYADTPSFIARTMKRMAAHHHLIGATSVSAQHHPGEQQSATISAALASISATTSSKTDRGTSNRGNSNNRRGQR